MTARTEKKKLERREKSKTNRGDCEKVHHRYAETHSRSLKKQTGADSPCKHCQACRKGQKKEPKGNRVKSAKIKSHDRENPTGLGHASTDKPFFYSKEHPRMQSSP